MCTDLLLFIYFKSYGDQVLHVIEVNTSIAAPQTVFLDSEVTLWEMKHLFMQQNPYIDN